MIETHSLACFFAQEEITLYANDKQMKSLAARYLIKDIIKKHLYKDLSYRDIIILNESDGRPKLSIKKTDTNKHVHISLTHTRVRAGALVIIETKDALNANKS